MLNNDKIQKQSYVRTGIYEAGVFIAVVLSRSI